MWVQSLDQEDPLEEGMATQPSIHVWRIPMDRGDWHVMVHRVAKSQTRLKPLSTHTHTQRENSNLPTRIDPYEKGPTRKGDAGGMALNPPFSPVGYTAASFSLERTRQGPLAYSWTCLLWLVMKYTHRTGSVSSGSLKYGITCRLLEWFTPGKTEHPKTKLPHI